MKDAYTEPLMNETVKKVRRKSIVYTDKWEVNIDHRYKFSDVKGYINGAGGFRLFAMKRLIRHHGI